MNEKLSTPSSPPPRFYSLTGLLSLLVGFGLFYACWKYWYYVRSWSDTLRIASFTSAFGLTLWGLKQIITDWQSRKNAQAAKRQKKNRVSIPVEGIIFLVIMSVMFVGSMLGRNNMLLLVFSVLAGAFVMNGYISFNLLRKLRVKRQVPSMVVAGEPVNVYLEVSNNKRMAVWVLTVTDELNGHRESLEANVVFTRIGGHQRKISRYQLQLVQRGRYTLGPLILSTRFPLGIVERSTTFVNTEEIIVCPQLGRLAKTLSQRINQDQLVLRNATRAGTYDDEFHRIREYRRGDNPRAIHWRTSARRNELMVREYHESRDDNLTVLLDLWQPHSAGIEDWECVETTVSFAATLIHDHIGSVRDSEIRIACQGAGYSEWCGQSGLGGWQSILAFLALAESGHPDSFDFLQDFWARHHSPHTRFLLLTTRTLDEVSRLIEKPGNHRKNGATGNFEREVLIYSCVTGALEGIFELPEILRRSEPQGEERTQQAVKSPPGLSSISASSGSL